MAETLRVFELYPVPLSELHDWLEARGLVVCEHSVWWGDKLDVAVVETTKEKQCLDVGRLT